MPDQEQAGHLFLYVAIFFAIFFFSLAYIITEDVLTSYDIANLTHTNNSLGQDTLENRVLPPLRAIPILFILGIILMVIFNAYTQ